MLLPLFAAGCVVPGSWGLARADTPAPREGESELSSAERDSLRHEVRRYTKLISSLRDSLSKAERTGTLDELRGQEILDHALEELGGAISGLGRELSDLDLNIDDQTISLRDADGEGIEIRIPEDLGEQISRGISSITTAILNELPDTLSFRPGHKALEHIFRVEKPRQLRRVTGGDAIKIRDDVLIEADEEVRGHVVVIFGDAMIAGKVNGNVVGLFSDVDLAETAEVTGQVVVIGRLNRVEEADVQGSVLVVKPPYLPREMDGIEGLFGVGWVAFLAKQVEFFLVALLVLILLAVFPRPRLHAIESALRENPGGSLGYGIVVSVMGHVALIILFGVLVLTVIGIPLALLLILAYVAAGLLCLTVAALQVGRRAVELFNLPWQQEWVLAVLGLFLLHAVTFVGSLFGLWPLLGPLTWLLGILGLGIKLLALSFGVGALVLSRLGSQGSPQPASASGSDSE